jgi:extracellular elastinolytic metalloproteinase
MRTQTLGAILVLLLTLAIAPVAADDATEGSQAADVAIAHLAGELGADDVADVAITDEYTSEHNGVTHVYLRQRHDGLEVLGAEATVNVQDGEVLHAGHRFIDGLAANASGVKVLSADAALTVAALHVDADRGLARSAPVLRYRALDDGTARLVYDLELVTGDHWWNISVDAETGAIAYQADFVDDAMDTAQIAARTVRPEAAGAVEAVLSGQGALEPAIDPILPPEQVDDGSSYNVYALPLESPNDGPRSIVRNPADAVASPFGWHDTDGVAGPEHTITRGNNVNAYADTVQINQPDPGSQPDGGASLTFDHPILTFDATPAVYRDAAVTNLFYWNNIMHDVTYRYGFDEAAGNFQQTNYTGQGKGGDAVQAEAQDGGGALNANFATPADGSPGRMQMYVWVDAFQSLGLTRNDIVRDYSTQVRDGDLDAGVIAHEYGHGVSNRLVGGPSNVSCLRTHAEREGEGWSDWWSFAMTMREGDDGATPRGIGTYVIYQDEGRTAKGIRITPYSTDMEVNPSTYNTIRTAAAPHGVGYVWASMLWDMYWNLVEVHGFNPNPYEDWTTGGNNLAIQLVIDGMKLSPCTPGFADARDAIIAADQALTGDAAAGVPGDNECLIWETFARRGLGVDADQGDPNSKTDGIEGYAVPPACTG